MPLPPRNYTKPLLRAPFHKCGGKEQEWETQRVAFRRPKKKKVHNTRKRITGKWTTENLSAVSPLYVILKPIDKIKGIADDEVVVFRARDDGQGDCYLKEETDDVIARKVFGEYQKLLLAHVNESDSSDIPPK